ncbi:hypothetical protein, partial [Streptomyces sp. NPDC002962]|uniref:hypothetical protein n=1 Tax=Streptomyces sp. NPDC002962 TaxID=3364674 RepID=UPI003699BE4E
LTDSVNGKKNEGKAKESVQVVDVSQLLLESVRTPAGPAGPQGPQGPPESQDAARAGRAH